jgi:hypothetical protein
LARHLKPFSGLCVSGSFLKRQLEELPQQIKTVWRANEKQLATPRGFFLLERFLGFFLGKGCKFVDEVCGIHIGSNLSYYRSQE